MKTNTKILTSNNFKMVNTYDIYIGLNSNISKENIIPFHQIESLIFDFFTKKQLDFSMSTIDGGYTYSDQSFNTEQAIVITLVNGDKAIIERICRNLKMILEQESIGLIKREMEMLFI